MHQSLTGSYPCERFSLPLSLRTESGLLEGKGMVPVVKSDMPLRPDHT